MFVLNTLRTNELNTQLATTQQILEAIILSLQLENSATQPLNNTPSLNQQRLRNETRRRLRMPHVRIGKTRDKRQLILPSHPRSNTTLIGLKLSDAIKNTRHSTGRQTRRRSNQLARITLRVTLSMKISNALKHLLMLLRHSTKKDRINHPDRGLFLNSHTGLAWLHQITINTRQNSFTSNNIFCSPFERHDRG